MKPYQN